MANQDSLAILRDDHVRALAVLERLAQAVAALVSGESVGQHRNALEEAARFFAHNLTLHLRQEEEVLFPALEEVMGPGAGPPTVMRWEHQELNEKLADFSDWLEQWADSDAPWPSQATSTLQEIAYNIIGILRPHIAKEDEILFPMAERLLSQERLRDVGEEMRRLAG